jgi:hypothetical protein
MIPVSVQDVVEGVATAQHVFKVGFRKANNASKSTHAAKVTELDIANLSRSKVQGVRR